MPREKKPAKQKTTAENPKQADVVDENDDDDDMKWFDERCRCPTPIPAGDDEFLVFFSLSLSLAKLTLGSS